MSKKNIFRFDFQAWKSKLKVAATTSISKVLMFYIKVYVQVLQVTRKLEQYWETEYYLLLKLLGNTFVIATVKIISIALSATQIVVLLANLIGDAD